MLNYSNFHLFFALFLLGAHGDIIINSNSTSATSSSSSSSTTAELRTIKGATLSSNTQGSDSLLGSSTSLTPFLSSSSSSSTTSVPSPSITSPPTLPTLLTTEVSDGKTYTVCSFSSYGGPSYWDHRDQACCSKYNTDVDTSAFWSWMTAGGAAASPDVHASYSCCGDCALRADKIDVYFWPGATGLGVTECTYYSTSYDPIHSSTVSYWVSQWAVDPAVGCDGTGTGNADPVTTVIEGYTLTSPTPAIGFTSFYAYNWCGKLGGTTGFVNAITDALMTFVSSATSTVNGQLYSSPVWAEINFADYEACTEDCHPRVSIRYDHFGMGDWKGCDQNIYAGYYDPPRAISKVDHLDGSPTPTPKPDPIVPKPAPEQTPTPPSKPVQTPPALPKPDNNGNDAKPGDTDTKDPPANDPASPSTQQPPNDDPNQQPAPPPHQQQPNTNLNPSQDPPPHQQQPNNDPNPGQDPPPPQPQGTPAGQGNSPGNPSPPKVHGNPTPQITPVDITPPNGDPGNNPPTNGAPAPRPGNQAAVLTIGGQAYTPDAISHYLIGGVTLLPGGPTITVSGTPIAIAPGASALIVGTVTSDLPIPQLVPSAPLPVATVNGQVVTPNADGSYIIGGQILAPGGSAVTVDGTVLSLPASGTAVTTLLLTSPTTLDATGLGLIIMSGLRGGGVTTTSDPSASSEDPQATLPADSTSLGSGGRSSDLATASQQLQPSAINGGARAPGCRLGVGIVVIALTSLGLLL